MDERAKIFRKTGNVWTSATRIYGLNNLSDSAYNRESEELSEMYKKIQLEINEIGKIVM